MNDRRCVACGGELQLGAFDTTDAVSGERFSIDVCAECGHGTTRPVPSDLSRYYPPEYYGGRHGLTDRYCTARRVRWLRRLSAPGPLLDLGCGDGSFLRSARDHGYTPHGVEVGGARALAEQAGLLVFGTTEEAASRAPYRVATAWHSLEHFPDPSAELRRLHGLLQVGGRLIVAVPDFGGAQAQLYRGAWLHLDAPRHLHHFTASSLERVLGAAGFRVLETHHQELEYDVFGWIQSTENWVSARKNRAFELVRGGPAALPAREALLSGLWVAASAPSALAVTLVSTLAGRGGTLVLFAERA